MSRQRRPFYGPHTNGDAVAKARRIKGLDEEIALLRARLNELVKLEPAAAGVGGLSPAAAEAINADRDAVMFRCIAVLVRAVLAQARIDGSDPQEAMERMQEAFQTLNISLEAKP